MQPFRRLSNKFDALARKVKDPLVPLGFGMVLLLVAGALLIRDLVDSGGPDSAEAQLSEPSPIWVAASDLTQGTAGETLLSQGLIEHQHQDAPPGALGSQAQIVGKVLARDLAAGQPITAADLRPVTAREEAAVVVPEGMEGVALTLPFTAGGAGYVGIGDRVKVYAVIDSPEGTRLVLVDSGVKVLDVSAEIAPYAGSVEPRPAGSNLTLLLALEPEVAAAVMLIGSDATFHLSLMDSDGASETRSGTLTLGDYLATLGPWLDGAAEPQGVESHEVPR